MAFSFLLCLLLAKGLALEGTIALTFSSRIIHRFSDEARVHLASRGNGGEVQSWPKRSSSEYFRLLLNSDLTRQKMKLGSQYESLYPSEGSQTLFFGNAFSWLHYTWIDIGTPNVSFLVALDTGSNMLWVPCDCIECAPFSAGHYDLLDRDLNQYSPSLSTTSRHLPCSHQLCSLSSICKVPKDPCPYRANYASANTSSSGFIIEDKLHLASSSRHAAKDSVQASIIFGCGRKQSGAYLDGAAPDGVLGLGPGSISVPSLLAKAGLIKNSFSICFNDKDYGRILFGDQGHVTHQYTPLFPLDEESTGYFVGVERFCVGSFCHTETGFQAQIDSGTSFTYLPYGVYKKVVAEFDKQVNITRTTRPREPWEYCYKASSQELVNVPPMKIIFSKNQTFLIQNPLHISQEYSLACLTVFQADVDYGTIGQNFLIGYRTVFDRENLQFGWSKSNCQDSTEDTTNFTSPSNGRGSPISIPVNQQQTIPNKTHAVPPAVAGKAYPKPSTAAPGLASSNFLTTLSLMCLLFFSLFG